MRKSYVSDCLHTMSVQRRLTGLGSLSGYRTCPLGSTESTSQLRGADVQGPPTDCIAIAAFEDRDRGGEGEGGRCQHQDLTYTGNRLHLESRRRWLRHRGGKMGLSAERQEEKG